MTEHAGQIRIPWDDQERFARLSGDFNPVHLDPVTARRGMFGVVIVHGVHLLIRALDVFASHWQAESSEGLRIEELEAGFPSPTVPEEALDLVVKVDTGPPRSSFRVTAGNAVRGRFRFEFSQIGRHSEADRELPAPSDGGPSSPRELSLDEMEGKSGSLQITGDGQEMENLFPDACTVFGLGPLAELLAMSRLVGMRCPGLNSALSQMRLSRPGGEGGGAGSVLRYRVLGVDRRFGRVEMEVSASVLAGTIQAFSPPGRQEQASMDSIYDLVEAGEFTGQRAVVAGGSRGLGEATAKLLCAGGADTVLTYHRGESDARDVLAQMSGAPGTCRLCQYGAGDPSGLVECLSEMGFRPTHVYYFPSPPIWRGTRRRRLEPETFHDYAEVYVAGLMKLIGALEADDSEGVLKIFYPSTSALDEPVEELGEYAAAKAAGESLCRHLNRFDDRVTVLVERLPRVATDQTLTVMPVPAADAAEVMLPLIRELS